MPKFNNHIKEKKVKTAISAPTEAENIAAKRRVVHFRINYRLFSSLINLTIIYAKTNSEKMAHNLKVFKFLSHLRS